MQKLAHTLFMTLFSIYLLPTLEKNPKYISSYVHKKI